MAVSYGSTNVVPVWAMAKMFAIWAVVSLPLAVCGTILGRRFGSAAGAPLRVNPVPRPIPARPWYRSATFVCLLAGFLPFGSIFIETYFIFSSFSTYKFYYVFGFMFAVYVILVLTTSCVTVVSTYFLLNSEDHRWQWHAFFAGASTGLYVFVYACYYFLFRTEMTGLLQTAYFFAYTVLSCLALGLITGTIGVATSSVFVRAIYLSISAKLQ